MKSKRMGFRGVLLFILILALPVVMLQAQSAADAYDRGMLAVQKGDWNGAISQFDQAIQLNPHYDDAYYQRGYARQKKGDTDGAIADYNQALAVNANLDKAYTGRGFAKYLKGDLDGALTDYDQAIALNPHAVDAQIGKTNVFLSRGTVKLYKGDLDGAIADYNQAILRDGGNAMGYKMRGYAEYEKTYDPNAESDESKKALQDFQKAVDLNAKDQDYPRFFIWLIQVQDPGQADAATRDLADYVHLRPGNPTDWAPQVGLFLIGDNSESDLLKAMDSSDKGTALMRRCEGCFYIGMKRAYSGDQAGALSFFQQSVDTRQYERIEYEVAKARLNPVGQSNQNGDTPPQ
jgi:tetratricopeptide (TPR) repeat protein